MKKGLKFLLVFLILVMLLGGGIFYAAYSVSKSDTILKHVYVGDIPVEGLTQAQAQQLLLEQGWQETAEKPLQVNTYGNISFEVDRILSGAALSAERAAEYAFAYGHDGSYLYNLFTAISLYINPVDVNAYYRAMDSAYLDSRVETGLELLQEYVGEELCKVDEQSASMTTVKGWPALDVDSEDLKNEILDALLSGAESITYKKIRTEPTMPDFSGFLKEREREAADASYTEDGKFEVIDEVVGFHFDVAEAETLWKQAETGAPVQIPVKITRPEVTGEVLRSQLYRDLLGAATTKFPNSGDSRRSNLALATSKISEMILYPGDTFSYNEIVGVRTEEAGFLPAPAYVDGDVKDEIGGGACQVSSTLYAATVFAFLETVERECHYFPVNYMQMGTDATVTIPPDGGRTIDFKFRNNRNYPIKLVGICNNEESTLTFEIWGTLEEDDYMPIGFDNSYSWVYDYKRAVTPADPARPGYVIKLTHEKYGFEDETGPGSRTLTHRIVMDAQGTVVLDEIINRKLQNGNYAMDTYYQH